MTVPNENPNPRGWRSGWIFIDLGSVAAAIYDVQAERDAGIAVAPDGTFIRVMRLFLVNAGGVCAGNAQASEIELPLSFEQAKSLLDALEVYRSNR